MPDFGPWINPTDKPYTGSLSWEPPTPRSGFGGSNALWGFNPLRIERGRFRQDLPFENGSGTLEVASAGRTSAEGSEGWPLLVAFRPLQNPSLYRGVPPSDPFVAEGEDCAWSATLRTPSRVSSITFDYELTVDLADPELPKYLTSQEDQRALAAYLADRTANPRPDLDLSKLTFAKLVAVVDGEEKEFPEVASGEPKLQIPITGFTGDRAAPKSTTVRFGPASANNPSDFGNVSAVKIVARHKIASLCLKLSKVMLFDAQRVNVPYVNLPCSHLSYSFAVSFSVIVGGQLNGSLRYPNSGTTPTLYVKFFSPDFTSGSPGFAHALSMRFLLFALPEALGPGSTSGGVGGALGGGGEIYRAIFIGPVPATRNVRYTLTGQAVANAPGRLVAYDRNTIQQGVTAVAIDKSAHFGTSAPSSTAEWSQIAEVAVGTHPLDPDGPTPSPYLHLDQGARRNAWYRTRQRTANGGEIIGAAFQNSVYAERTIFRMTSGALASSAEDREMVVRRPTLVSALPTTTPLDAPPVALFWSEDDRLLVTGTTVASGAWSLTIRARKEDASGLVDSHLVVRSWLVPENLSPNSDIDTILSFRDRYELTFVSGERGLLKMGRAASLADVLVSPPLSGDLQDVTVARYVEGLDGVGDDRLTFDFGPNVRGRLVVGVSLATYPTADGTRLGYDPFARTAPRVSLEIDSDHGAFETTLQQTVTGEIQPMRYERYTSSRYDAAPKPLYASRARYGTSDLSGDGFVDYAAKVGGYDPSKPSVVALTGLCLLKSETTDVNVVLPFKEIPQMEGVEDAAVKGDFTTALPVAPGGRVVAGRWSVRMSVDVGADDASIEVGYRFEAFLATRNGRISYRVFRSPILSRDGSDVAYDVDIALPFAVSEATTELVVRVSAYPRARGGAVLTVDQLRRLYPDLKVGARIVRLSLAAHTYEQIKITQNDSAAGSPAFNEDLPIVPNRTLGGQGFAFVADENLTKELFLTRGQDWRIDGALYSATWQQSMPKNVEARIISQGIGDSTVFVRTVPTVVDGEERSDRRVAARQDRLDGSIHLAFQGSDRGVSALEDANADIRHAVIDRFGQRPRFDVKVLDGGGRPMPGTVPDLTSIRRGTGVEGGDVYAVTSQVDGDVAPDLQVALSGASAEPWTWSAAVAPYGSDAFAAPHRLVRGLQLCTTRAAAVDQTSLTVGWSEPGAVILRRTTAIDAKRTGVGEGDFHLVDGDPDAELAFEQTYHLPSGGTNGPAYRTFPAIATLPNGQTLVVYGLEGRPGQAWARIFDGTAVVGSAKVCAAIAGAGIPIGSEHEMRGFALAWSEDGAEGVLAFWCKGRIMIAPLELGPKGFRLHPVQLVAGPRDFTDDAALQAATAPSVRRLVVAQLGEPEAAIREQCPGVVIGQGFGSTGRVLVFYEDEDEQMWGREVVLGGVAKPRYRVR